MQTVTLRIETEQTAEKMIWLLKHFESEKMKIENGAEKFGNLLHDSQHMI